MKGKKVIKERCSGRKIGEYSWRERVVIACVIYIAQANGVELEVKRRGDRLKGKKRENIARGVNEWDVCPMERSETRVG